MQAKKSDVAGEGKKLRTHVMVWRNAVEAYRVLGHPTEKKAHHEKDVQGSERRPERGMGKTKRHVLPKKTQQPHEREEVAIEGLSIGG